MSKVKTKPRTRVTTKFSTDPYDPPYWPVGLMALEKIQLLAHVNPEIFQAVHALVDDALREAWRHQSHAAILQLLDQEENAGRPYQWQCDEPHVTKGGAK